MLVVPNVVKHFEPSAQFKLSGLLGLAWLLMWWRVGSDHPQDGIIGSKISINNNGLEEDAGPESGLLHKKEDPMPALSLGHTSSGGGGASASRGTRSSSPPAVKARAGMSGIGSGSRSAGIPWWGFIRTPAVWAIVVNNFAFHYATYVLMNWLPTYFESHIGVGLVEMSNWFTVSSEIQP